MVLGYLSLSWTFGPSLAWSDEKLQEAIKTTKAYWPSLKQMRKNRHGKRDSRVSERRKMNVLYNLCWIRRTQIRLKTLNNKGFQTGEDHRQEYIGLHHIVGAMHETKHFLKIKTVH